MKNIHVLPTENPSRLYFDIVTKELLLQDKLSLNATCFPIEKRNIYITSDEEIKDGDFAYDSTSKTIAKVDFIKDRGDGILIVGAHSINLDDNYTDLLSNLKKIILTTDQDLIKDGVQSIDDDFLEWFVKNPSCEEVEVEKLPYDGTKSISKYWSTYHGEYKIIISKEEVLLQSSIDGEPIWGEATKQDALETFKEAINKKYKFGISSHSFTNPVEIGGQQERMYSEEEVLEILNKFSASCYSPIEKFEIPGWFKKIKNK